jgi:hypothetical protein
MGYGLWVGLCKWLCGYVVMWLCGYVVMWLCGYVVMRLCGCSIRSLLCLCSGVLCLEFVGPATLNSAADVNEFAGYLSLFVG